MANFYVSSVAYTAVTQFAINHAYSSGDIIRQLAAPATNSERCFRCTTPGTSAGSEPAWNLGSNATTTSGGATFTECTAQEAHQHDNGVTNTWTAPAARINNLTSSGKNVLAATGGDTVFVSSDHAETQATTNTITNNSNGTTFNYFISVDRTSANLPPLSAQITNGASLSVTGAGHDITLNVGSFWQGFTFTLSGNSGDSIRFGDGTLTRLALKNCSITNIGAASNSGVLIRQGEFLWDNVTLSFASTSGQIQTNSSGVYWEWKNTPSAIVGGTLPTTLILMLAGSGSFGRNVIRGVDLSALGSGKTLVSFSSSNAGILQQISFRNCKLGASVTKVNTGSLPQAVDGWAEFINCDSGSTNYVNFWYKIAGTIDTETTITRAGGATDGSTKASRKLISNSTCTKDLPLWHDIWQWNALTGSSKTATVECISSASVNNNELWGQLEYLEDTGDCLSGFVDDYVADPLATAAAQTSSSATWDSSPATPVAQKISLTFTAQKAGLLHMRVYLGKASKTLYVDHKITVS